MGRLLMAEQCYAVVPAAGIGRRMESDLPKQYLALQGKTVIEHTLARLLEVEALNRIVVVTAEHDEIWPSLAISKNSGIITAPGGKERCHSVLNGLAALGDEASDDAWVLVHDAARPCVRVADIRLMFSTLLDHKVGGILAAPVRDTIKRANDEGAISQTVDRSGLWQAFTPQMFRLGMLRQALEDALAQEILVTDEAQAIERQGYHPGLVEGHTDNLKITRPEDLLLAALYLSHQASTSED